MNISIVGFQYYLFGVFPLIARVTDTISKYNISEIYSIKKELGNQL